MVRAIVGANWGDEGKGKITDMFAEESDVVVRFQGGANAGHTIICDYGKFALHQLPSGVFYPHITNIIGNGVALDVPKFLEELEHLEAGGVPAPHIIISERTQVLMPYHVLQDQYEEERLGGHAFGSTKSGIAPFYSDKYAKYGIQVCELFDEKRLMERLEQVCQIKNVLFEHLYHKPLLDPKALFQQLMGYREQIAPYVGNALTFVKGALADGKKVLLEAQLGAMKDPDFGIYPFTTSSHTLAAFGCMGVGVAPSDIQTITAVTKAYSSAVGAGAFVSELFGDEGDELRRRGGDAGEYGATTGRPRRVGWFDTVATRYGGPPRLPSLRWMCWAIWMKSRSASAMRSTVRSLVIFPLPACWNRQSRSIPRCPAGSATFAAKSTTPNCPRRPKTMWTFLRGRSAFPSHSSPPVPSVTKLPVAD